MCRLICAFVVCIREKQVFSWRGSYTSKGFPEIVVLHVQIVSPISGSICNDRRVHSQVHISMGICAAGKAPLFPAWDASGHSFDPRLALVALKDPFFFGKILIKNTLIIYFPNDAFCGTSQLQKTPIFKNIYCIIVDFTSKTRHSFSKRLLPNPSFFEPIYHFKLKFI